MKTHFLAVGMNAWGKGSSVDEAKKNCRAAGAPAKAVYKVVNGDSYVDSVDGQVSIDDGATAEKVWVK